MDEPLPGCLLVNTVYKFAAPRLHPLPCETDKQVCNPVAVLLWAQKGYKWKIWELAALVSPSLSNVISSQWVDTTNVTSMADANLISKTQNS